MIFLPVERKTIKDDCECKQDTWSAVFINQAHFAIPPTGVQLKDAAPGIKMGCCGKLCLLCQQQQILNKHFANHCNIGNTKKQDMLSMLRFYMRLWPNKEGGYQSVYWFLPSPGQPAKVRWVENIMKSAAAVGTA